MVFSDTLFKIDQNNPISKIVEMRIVVRIVTIIQLFLWPAQRAQAGAYGTRMTSKRKANPETNVGGSLTILHLFSMYHLCWAFDLWKFNLTYVSCSNFAEWKVFLPANRPANRPAKSPFELFHDLDEWSFGRGFVQLFKDDHELLKTCVTIDRPNDCSLDWCGPSWVLRRTF